MNHTVRVHRTLAMLSLSLVASCAPMPQAADPNTSAGYLAKEALPDSLTLLPPSPAAGSAALAHDEEVHTSAQALRNTPRYQLAALDADMSFPQGAGAFACTLGNSIDPEHTPRLLRLLRRSLMDAGRSTGNAKNEYRRTRPFAAHEEQTCTPQDEGILRNNGSYPSGHAAAGWTWALVLAEVDP
jgi:acid phosphatase (class A)